MKSEQQPGLGELLRYVGELVEHGADDRYREINLNCRARYTPVLRAMSAGAETISAITSRTQLTQGAVSRTVRCTLSAPLPTATVGLLGLDCTREHCSC